MMRASTAMLDEVGKTAVRQFCRQFSTPSLTRPGQYGVFGVFFFTVDINDIHHGT